MRIAFQIRRFVDVQLFLSSLHFGFFSFWRPRGKDDDKMRHSNGIFKHLFFFVFFYGSPWENLNDWLCVDRLRPSIGESYPISWTSFPTPFTLTKAKVETTLLPSYNQFVSLFGIG